MKVQIVITSVTIFGLLLLFGSSNTSANYGGSTLTTTSISMPSSIANGAEVTVTATSTYSGNPVFLGDIVLMKLQVFEIFGPVTDGYNLQVDDPVFAFTPTAAGTVRAMKIPINDIIGKSSISSSIVWAIYDEIDGNLLLKGDIDLNELDQMLAEQSLLLDIGTFQTDPTNWLPGQTISYQSGLNVLANEDYFLRFNSPVAVTYDLPTSSDSTPNLVFYDDTVVQSSYPSLTLYQGEYFKRDGVDGTGSLSASFTAVTGRYYILAHYSDGTGSGIFAPSHSWQILEVIGATPPVVTLGDISTSTGLLVDVIVNVNDGGIPVNGAIVSFYLDVYGINYYMGSATTSSGIATLNYLVVVGPGSYSYNAEVVVTGDRGVSSAAFDVSNPQAQWSGLQATGVFATALNTQSIITIEGFMLSTSGSPVTASINLYDDSQLLTTITSDQFGYFSHKYTTNLPVGTTTNMFEVEYTGSFWDISNLYVDAVVAKGILSINVNNVSIAYEGQPIIVNGIVKDSVDSNVEAYVKFERYENSIWIDEGTVLATSGIFSQTISTLDAATYLFRASILDSTHYYATYNRKLYYDSQKTDHSRMTRKMRISLLSYCQLRNFDLKTKKLK